MECMVKKWGNSAAIRIPAAVLAEAGMDLDQAVGVREERGRIIIEPARRNVFSIDRLVKASRKDNLHEPVDMGPPVGRETW